MKIKVGKMQRNPVEQVKSRRDNRRRFLLAALLSLYVFNGYGQISDRPFIAGETALYGAYFNWQFVWVNAGEVRFRCDTVPYRNNTAWRLEAIGKTFKSYDIFYTVRDTFVTILSYPGFNPLWFRRAVNHGRNSSVQQYDFLPDRGLIIANIQPSKQQSFTDSLAYSDDIHDLLSSAYLFRGFDYDNMKNGQVVKFKMLDDNKKEELYFRYRGTEKIKTRNGRKFLCHSVSVWLLEGDFFPEGEYMKVWFTADKNRVPVMVETKILVGSVKAVLEEVKNLKYPLTSEIK